VLAAGGHQLPLGARALHIVSRLIRVPGHRPGGNRSVPGQAAYHHGQGGGAAAIQGHQAVAVGGAAPAGIPLHQLGEGPPLHRTHRGGRLGVLLPGVADHKVQGLRVADRQLQQLLRIVLRTGQKDLRRRLLPGQHLKLVQQLRPRLEGRLDPVSPGNRSRGSPVPQPSRPQDQQGAQTQHHRPPEQSRSPPRAAAAPLGPAGARLRPV